MNHTRKLFIQGIPNNVAETDAAICRSRMLTAVNELLDKTHLDHINITVSNTSQLNNSNSEHKKSSDDLSVQERAGKYKASKPLFDFEKLVVPESVRDELLLALDLIQLESKIFDEWGLRKIEPFPRTALNFHGPSGTGKTLAAHAIASLIKRPILIASYAQIESMFHGEGPKNVQSLFLAAERDNAVLFIDEADSLLSKRLLQVTQGSEQAINSMRSELLICLERFRGIVIFATNLVQNYDKAFETRVRHVHFTMPDYKSRLVIWQRHIPEELPLESNIDFDTFLDTLAQVDDMCGRDIKNAVLDAAMRAARIRKNFIELKDLIEAIERIKAARITVTSSSRELEPTEKEEVSKKLREVFPNSTVSIDN
jgi:ATP-dependent 26S proteasome regulatory subunit